MGRTATFATFIKSERARLDKARKIAMAEKAGIDTELQAIETELAALDAYRRSSHTPDRMSKPAGKAAAGAPSHAGRRTSARRGEKRQIVLDCIQQHPGGLSRGEILVKMGAKGDKSAEQSVSNALAALKKSAKVNNRQGRYVPV